MTGEPADAERVSFLESRVPCPFELRVVVLPAGARRVYHPAEWRDELVVIERGVLELESRDGCIGHFQRGDIICLARLAVRMLHNRGPEPVVLTAVTRARPPLLVC